MNPDHVHNEPSNLRAAQALIGHNVNRLRSAAQLTREALANEIGLDAAALSALEAGSGLYPIGLFLAMAATFRISLQELIVELGKDGTLPILAGTQAVAEIAALTQDRIEIIRLRDAIEAERLAAERQLELLTRRRGKDDVFTREAARRLNRLADVLEVNDA
jgi:transcriptional regulator with XRE-family HTH domain